jgi:hypothetical protein
LKKAIKKRIEGVFIWAVIGLMDLFPNSNPLLDCLSLNILEELLNDFSKYYPNLTLIKKTQRFGIDNLGN